MSDWRWAVLIAMTATPLTGLAEDDATPKIVKLRLENLPSISGRDDSDWTQARTALVPGERPLLLTTTSLTGKTGTHAYHDIHQTLSRDGGKTWSTPEVIPSLKRFQTDDGYEVAPGDLWPTWHARSGKVLVTGKTFNFERGAKENRLRERVSYAVMDPKSGAWGPLRLLELPPNDHSGAPIVAANAGCNQPFPLPNGQILLPIRYRRGKKAGNYTTAVARCAFDGETLRYLEHGSEHTIERQRGLYEPSVIGFGGEFFLTMRADHSAYVSRSDDGLNYTPIKEWTFDDGEVLGSYNTQQHWVSAGGGLFLVYTRRGADNDHVFRHRAPLFIAQVDPQRLQVLRATERILLPENGATLGNSGVCRVSDRESLVTCGEGRVSLGPRRGENNRILYVRITVN
ncbi:MAG: sialidase family protein [Pirellulaceae bacterium]